MGNKTSDLRVKRTCSLLSLALLDLMQTRSFDKISVMNICERAMVHRATFYLHFTDKYDLLRYIMDRHAEQLTEASIKDNAEFIKDAAEKFFRDIEKNYGAYRNIVQKNDSLTFMKAVSDNIYRVVYGKLERGFDGPKEIIEARAALISGGAAMLAVKMCTAKTKPDRTRFMPEINRYIESIVN